MSNIYLFYGEDQKMIQEEVNRWKEGFLNKYPDSPNLSVTRDVNIDSLIIEALTTPFLGEKRLIIAYNVYSNNKGTKEYDKFAKELANIPDTSILVLVEEESIPKNAKIIKDVDKNGQSKNFPKSANSLRKSFEKILKKNGKRMDSYLIEELIFNLNEDPFKLENEALKLCLRSDNEEITKQDVEDLVRFDAQISVFKLMDNLTDKKVKKCLETLNDLNQSGEDLVRLFHLLIRQIRILTTVKSLGEQNLTAKEIAKASKLQPFIVNKILRQVDSFSSPKLNNLLIKLLEIDSKIKTGKIKFNKNNRTELLFELEKFLITAAS